MENDINITKILKDKPHGTKLYADAFGELSIVDVCTEDEPGITLSEKNGLEVYFYNDGRYSIHGEPILVPSKSMHDWSKFSWKRGDILVCDDERTTMVIFDKWYDDTYTSFYGRHYFSCENKNSPIYYNEFLCSTVKYSLKNNQYANHDYIKAIEERTGRSLNLKTLELEDKLPKEVKDGDIITFNNGIILIYCANMVMSPERTEIYFHSCLKNGKLMFNTYLMSNGFGGGRYSTEEEKIKLFDALTKEGKYWDAEIKKIVDIKPKVELKPFDKVLVRDCDYNVWQVSLFGYQTSNNYYCCNGRCWIQCIPYEGNEHLLGRKA